MVVNILKFFAAAFKAEAVMVVFLLIKLRLYNGAPKPVYTVFKKLHPQLHPRNKEPATGAGSVGIFVVPKGFKPLTF